MRAKPGRGIGVCFISIMAVFLCTGAAFGATIYVDDDAPNDPGPGDPTISDPLADGSAEHPFDAIQKAIDAAVTGSTVLVADGTYTGIGNQEIIFGGKRITVRSQNGPRNCIINFQQDDTGILFIYGETSSTVLDGVTIMGHSGLTGIYYKASIYIQNSSPRIANCVFTDNRMDAIYIQVGSPTIEHCEFTDNSGGVYGDPMTGIVRDCVFYHNLGMGIYLSNQSKGQIDNCLLYENGTYYGAWAIAVYYSDATITRCTITMQGNAYLGTFDGTGIGISIGNSSDIPHTVGIEQTIVWGCEKPISYLDNTRNVTVSVRYSDIEGGYTGEGNIDTNPRFLRMGRWDPMGTPDNLYDDEWVQGDYHLSQESPCINAGDPLFVGGSLQDIDDQVRIAYGRVDIGADEYVGTDFDHDGKTTLTDFGTFAEQWMRQACGLCGWADYTGDETVDLNDLAVFIPEWLRMPAPEGMPRPILYCPFDRNTQNIASQFQFNGPWWVPQYVTDDSARVGSGAIMLDGKKRYVIYEFPNTLNGWPRTVAAWINTTLSVGVLLQWGGALTTGELWMVEISGGKLKVDVNGGSIQGTVPVNTGQWVHVAVVLPPRYPTRTTRDIRLYVNGICDTSAIILPASINTGIAGSFQLGNYSGLLDDLRIYDRGLEPSELADITGLLYIDAGNRQVVDLHDNNKIDLIGQIINASRNALVQWEQIRGPEMVSIANPTTLSPTVEFNREGEYAFRMTVRDGVQIREDTAVVLVDRGEVGHWTFDGNSYDLLGEISSGFGNPTFVGAEQAKVGDGALVLDGHSSIVTGFSGIFGTAARTCAAWIKTTETYAPILFWGDQNVAGGVWNMWVGSDGRLELQIGNGGVYSASPINTGQWVHVAVVLPDHGTDTHNIQVYVNGVEQTGEIIAGAIHTTFRARMRIGADEVGNFFRGLIDDVRVYNRALTQQEIAQLVGTIVGNAGPDQKIASAFGAINIPVQLAGEILNGSDTATSQWSIVSGPGEVVFENAAALKTQAIFPVPGKYTLRLTVTDGSQAAQDEVNVFVSTGEVGYWGMDGDYSDSANGYTGTPAGDPVFVDQSQAKVGTGAIQFDGGTYVFIPSFLGVTGTKARTCMAWIKTTGTVGPIVYWGDKSTAGAMWEMRVNGSGQLRAQFNGCGVSGVTTINTGQWVHVAAVLPEGGNNADDVLLYVNGALETGGVVTAGAINTKAVAAFRIGTNEGGNYFTGLIDDVRVYDRALTAAEIAGIAGQ